jgi:schlafen family protein
VCAFANTNGGTIYIGLSADPKKPPLGVRDIQASIDTLQYEISRMIAPPLKIEIDAQKTQGKPIIRVQVPAGEEPPYAIEDNKIYVRDEADTSLAVLDEIVGLVRRGLEKAGYTTPPAPSLATASSPETVLEVEAAPTNEIQPPKTGVEIIAVEERGDERYYTMHDLRNGNIVKNVSGSAARRLWHYAISEYESHPVRADKVQWHGDIGLWQRYGRQDNTHYDLVQRRNEQLRVYYGVSEGGMQGGWQVFLTPEEEE